jgi:hypothetical protein
MKTHAEELREKAENTTIDAVGVARLFLGGHVPVWKLREAVDACEAADDALWQEIKPKKVA